MISGKKNALGIALLMLLMAVTGVIVLRGQPLSLLGAALKQLRPQYILLALGFMFAYVSCEALCTKQILGRLGGLSAGGRGGDGADVKAHKGVPQAPAERCGVAQTA